MLKFDPGKMPFHWYKVNNHSSGNIGNFNYWIVPRDGHMQVSWWYGIYSYERTKVHHDRGFEMSEAGLQQAWQWLEEEFNSLDPNEVEKPLSILDEQPYTPPPAEDEAPF